MKKTTILYLHVSTTTKKKLVTLCKKQTGRVSQSTMAEQLLVAAMKARTTTRTKTT